MKEVRVGMLGFGGIARAHKHAYETLAKENYPVKLVAICDIDENQFKKELSINISSDQKSSLEGINTYTDLDEMLKNEQLDTIDICLPTYLHKEYAVKLLNLGYNVQSEKPMGLNHEECLEMMAAQRKSGKRLMIGQCLRFSPYYLAAKKIIDSGKYGKVLSMNTERLSSLPGWGFEGWYRDDKRAGGAMFDLGIHDYDMAIFLFGNPSEVSAVSVNGETIHEWSQSRLFYPDGKIVCCTASWHEAPGFPFTSNYRITMEKATIVNNGSKVMLYADGKAEELPLVGCDHMTEEIRFFADTVLNDKENEVNPPVASMNTVNLADTLKQSASQNGKRIPYIALN